ncbi:MAG: Stk1 family PASTA domain-containing Ser/Thr kinase, partial [Oscillospiraceae bacterium]|nr:Stk1 family PASTA domain-containing Ser/Thr kinase [Oscillospiraceae bacterium]
MQDVFIGQMLDNRYEILDKIGIGGMSVVYKGMDNRLNRLVAIKLLRNELATDAEFRKRFYAESQAVAMLSHPNIVSVYDVSHSNNIDYIVMELIDGITLKQYINHRGKLSWKETLHFAIQITKALQHAHSRGIIHRDIKPQNIMILKDGSIKVADFGIAYLESSQNTISREAMGSVHYMSPEQAKGGSIDARSDIYSVGVVMYEMLTGRLPFEGDTAVSIAIQHISSMPLMPRDLVPEIPAGMEAITMRAMESDINARYASSGELLHDLEEFRKNPSEFNMSAEYIALPEDDENEDDSTRFIPLDTVSISETTKREAKKPKRRTSLTSSHVTKEEYARNRRRSSRTSMLVGIFCVLVVLIGLFVFMWKYFLKDMLDPEEQVRVSIPMFVGQPLS